MAAALSDIEAPTAADVYNRLRQAFPLAPLSARVGIATGLVVVGEIGGGEANAVVG